MIERSIPALAAACLLVAAGCSRDEAPRESESEPRQQAAAAPQSNVPAPGSEGGPAPVIPFQGEAAPPTVQDGVVLRVLAEGQIGGDGTMTMPAMEQDLVYLMARVETESGAPITDAHIQVTTDSGNQVLLDEDKTDEYGYAAFTLFVSEPGLAEFTLAAAGVETRFRIDVMSLDASPWLQGLQGEGITPWSTLRGARIRFSEDGAAGITADFGEALAALDGQRIRLSGYMMPMTPDFQQNVFLLSASPPNCFFHMPGGPTTVALVETGADTPVPMTMEPLVVEGRLQLERASEQGLVYRLVDARPART